MAAGHLGGLTAAAEPTKASGLPSHMWHVVPELADLELWLLLVRRLGLPGVLLPSLQLCLAVKKREDVAVLAEEVCISCTGAMSELKGTMSALGFVKATAQSQVRLQTTESCLF